MQCSSPERSLHSLSRPRHMHHGTRRPSRLSNTNHLANRQVFRDDCILYKHYRHHLIKIYVSECCRRPGHVRPMLCHMFPYATSVVTRSYLQNFISRMLECEETVVLRLLTSERTRFWEQTKWFGAKPDCYSCREGSKARSSFKMSGGMEDE